MKIEHALMPELRNSLNKGHMSCCEFVRLSALSGILCAGKDSAAQMRRGGTLKVATAVTKITHPAQFSWNHPRNQVGQIAEYLAIAHQPRGCGLKRL